MANQRNKVKVVDIARPCVRIVVASSFNMEFSHENKIQPRARELKINVVTIKHWWIG
jgi:hypothetical protein